MINYDFPCSISTLVSKCASLTCAEPAKISLVFAASHMFFRNLNGLAPHMLSANSTRLWFERSDIAVRVFYETSRPPVNELPRTAKLAAVMDSDYWSERYTANR